MVQAGGDSSAISGRRQLQRSPFSRQLVPVMSQLCDIEVLGKILFTLGLTTRDEPTGEKLQYLALQVQTHAMKGLAALDVAAAAAAKHELERNPVRPPR